MTRFAIDPPTLLRIIDSGQQVNSDHQLVAPNSIRSLALDLLLPRVRSGELSEAAAMKLHESMTELKIRLLGDRVSRRTAWRIATERGWTSIREAEYLAVAMLQADALVTVDPELAVKATGVVRLAEVADVLTP
jgi:predicted nucleic acid-binding protein